jgi:glycosyl transferase family 25
VIADIPIFIINLAGATERIAHATSELKRQGLTFKRVAAVDAKRLDVAALTGTFDEAKSQRTYHVPMQKGEIACFLSHRLAWQRFLSETDAPFAIILEDDFEMRGNLASLIEALAAAELPPWDMIKLWGKRRAVAQGVAKLPAGRRLTREPVLSKRTVGQAVSRAGAEKLLATTLPIHRPIDVELQNWWELGVNILTLTPPVVVDVGDEAFGGSSVKEKVTTVDGAKLGRELRRTRLRVKMVARSLAEFAKAALGSAK